jgi:hypothetical protein
MDDCYTSQSSDVFGIKTVTKRNVRWLENRIVLLLVLVLGLENGIVICRCAVPRTSAFEDEDDFIG